MKKTKVLIVDDVDANLYLLRVLLNNAGYETVEALNGQLALDAAENADIDLVVSDILMPTMDGFEFCKIWKQTEKFRSIPFIFYTATYTEQKDREFALNLGADLFLVKPMESYSLLREIEKVLKNIQVKSPSEAVSQPVIEDSEYYEKYSSVLVQKLEAKLLQLEQKNKELMHRDSDLRQLNDSLQFQLSKVQLTEESLREHEKELLSILNSMTEGVLTADDRGVIYEFNPAAENIFGFARKEVVGESLEVLMPMYIRSKHKELLKSFVETTDVQLIARDMKALNKEGVEFPIRISVARLPQADLKRQMFICTFLDVSKEKQQEEIIARKHKMEAIGSLSGGIAHDYNNMLGVILGYAGLLHSKVDDDKDKEYIEHITNAAERGASLTRKLLSFSKKKAESKVLVNINEVILDDIDVLKKLLMEKIELQFDMADDIPDILIDKNDFDDSILNLCINAMHAMPNGGYISIQTTTEQINTNNTKNLAAGNYVHLVFEDNGFGMSESVIENVFEPFFTTKGEKGTGLGLSQVYGFVQRSNGFISLESEIDKGTRFDIYFPEATGRVSSLEGKITNNNLIINGNYVIMLVDDEPVLLGIFTKYVESFGCKVIKAHGGEDALSKLKNQKVDLLISDVIMPGMDGFQLVEIATEIYPELKAFLMSGYNDIGNKKHRLQKPFTKEEMYEAIIEFLD